MALSLLLPMEVTLGNVAGSSVSLILACLLIGSTSVHHLCKAGKAVSSMVTPLL
jgi:hypothetical protein